MKLTPTHIRRFRHTIWSWYKRHRRALPWRETDDPYRIVVSEVMLQQTQVPRVVEKYRAFISRFPTWRALARARQRSVLKVWQGLGYNRRARSLQQLARILVKERAGTLPQTVQELEQLPGIGAYTAAAIMVFAFGRPEPMIETNIRAVFIDTFFRSGDRPTDKEIERFIRATMDTTDPREWFYALMDYGSELKRRNPGIGRRSAHYVRQSRFEGSIRQVRGAIIRELVQHGALRKRSLFRRFAERRVLAEQVLSKLVEEGLVQESKGVVSL